MALSSDGGGGGSGGAGKETKTFCTCRRRRHKDPTSAGLTQTLRIRVLDCKKWDPEKMLDSVLRRSELDGDIGQDSRRTVVVSVHR